MDFWTIFWTIVFAMTILVYSGLALVVTVGGWKDVRAMFRALDEQHETTDDQ